MYIHADLVEFNGEILRSINVSHFNAAISTVFSAIIFRVLFCFKLYTLKINTCIVIYVPGSESLG